MKTNKIPVEIELLTEQEASKLIKISISTLRSWRRKKLIKALIIGRHTIRYRKSDILSFLENNRRKSKR